jgi:hypothetical protein
VVMMKETPINHNIKLSPICNCGAVLYRPISIREGRCQACRNEDARRVPGYGR